MPPIHHRSTPSSVMRHAQRGFAAQFTFIVLAAMAVVSAGVILTADLQDSPAHRLTLLTEQSVSAQDTLSQCVKSGDCVTASASGAAPPGSGAGSAGQIIDMRLLSASAAPCLGKLCPLPGGQSDNPDMAWNAYFTEQADGSMELYAQNAGHRDYSATAWTPQAVDGVVRWHHGGTRLHEQLPPLPLAKNVSFASR
jgi:hypothetical protein